MPDKQLARLIHATSLSVATGCLPAKAGIIQTNCLKSKSVNVKFLLSRLYYISCKNHQKIDDAEGKEKNKRK
jgi:hypothetical protein